jgi:hypothetical protein
VTVKPTNPQASPIGALLHLNLRVDRNKIEEYCGRLTEMGIAYRHSVRYVDPDRPGVMRAVNNFDVYEAPGEGALMSSVYINDPSGIQIEFNSWLPGWEKWPNDAIAQSDVRV